ncbi:MAG TPA: pyridoxine 5'-phosphate oxidase C-terminal domain-containing protein, partial [Actinomycetales bacterium]
QVASSASHQSQPVGSRAELEAAVAQEEERWPDTGSPTDVPLPQGWGGYLVTPETIELWVGQPSRLHDRILFSRKGGGDMGDDGSWSCTRLQP